MISPWFLSCESPVLPCNSLRKPTWIPHSPFQGTDKKGFAFIKDKAEARDVAVKLSFVRVVFACFLLGSFSVAYVLVVV